MTTDPVEAIARAVLYEGYLLYPYRPSAVKNQFRWTIGGVHPKDSGEPWRISTECLLEGEGADLDVELRYLQPVPGGVEGQPWGDAVEHRVRCSPGRMLLDQPGGVTGTVTLNREPVDDGLSRVAVAVENTTPVTAPGREAALPFTMASAHLVLRARDGRFVSATSPPEAVRAHADACRQEGLWPVMVGSPETADTVLAAPMILEDYPRISDESPGDLFDGTEIDEILTLRILTLTDAEKAEIRRTDSRARAMLERTEALTEDELMSLHGKLRS